MTISLTPSEFNVDKALRLFLATILPSNIKIIRGQTNRVPEPADTNFLVMTPIRRTPFELPVDQFVDAKFVGSIAGNLMTITGVDYGSLKVGSLVFGVGVTTSVSGQVSGSVGGTGVYSVSPSGTIGSEVLAAGVLDAIQSTEVVIQIDVHGPNGGDNAQRVLTMLRDQYAFDVFSRQGLGVFPLTAESRGQIPFINAEQAYEDRWIIEASLQVNASVSDIPQEFFDSIIIGFTPVDIKYLP